MLLQRLRCQEENAMFRLPQKVDLYVQTIQDKKGLYADFSDSAGHFCIHFHILVRSPDFYAFDFNFFCVDERWWTTHESLYMNARKLL